MAVCEEEAAGSAAGSAASQDRSAQDQDADADADAASPMQLLAPPADEAPRRVSGTFRVEFSVSLQTVYDERDARQPLPSVREPSADILGEEGEVVSAGGASSATAVSQAMSTALQTDMEVEEEAAASLRAELVAVEPAPTLKEYDVEVRAEQDAVLVQLSTSAGRLFRKAYELYSNVLEVRDQDDVLATVPAVAY